MSQILVQDLTFYYEESGEMIFDRLSVSLDTDWRLGLIGRNGRGKTTFLKLLAGEYGYRGLIRASVPFEYFPFPVRDPGRPALEVLEDARPGLEFWKLLREISLQEMDPELLYRPFASLSGGERTRLMLALLFSDDRAFLLIDEPTNTYDADVVEAVAAFRERYELDPTLLYASPDLLTALDDAVHTLDGESYVLDDQLQVALEMCKLAAAKPQQYTALPDGSWTKN